MKRRTLALIPLPRRGSPVHVFVALIALAGFAAWRLFSQGLEGVADSNVVVAIAALAVAFYLAEAYAVHVHFRSETHSISLNEIGLVVGLLFVPPTHLILTQLAAAGVALWLKRRQRRIKLAFNLATFMLSTSLAIAVFHAVLGNADPFGGRAWLAVVLASCVASLTGIVLVTVVIYLAEREWSFTALLRTGSISISATVATSSFVIASILLVRADSWALTLLVAPALGVAFMFRSFMEQSRSHEHLTFLYESMAATQGAPDFGLAVSQLLTALKGLVRAEYAEILILLSDDATALRSVSGRGSDLLLQPVALSDRERQAVATVVDSGGAVLVAKGQDPGRIAGFMRSRDMEDALLATLADEERVFGLMVAGARGGDIATFTRDELSLVRTFAGHAAVLLENGRLEKTLADVTELQEKLHHLAYHDPLTGLPNRGAFLELVDSALVEVDPASPPAVLFLDVDDFKTINDTHGHAVGDELLVALAKRLQNATAEEHATAARLGGDEFAVLLRNAPGDAAEAKARDILKALANPVTIGSKPFPIAPSIGVALGTDELTTDDLMRNADVAMYAAKTAGKGGYTLFHPSMYERIRDRHDLAHDLRRALDEDEILPHFQPIVRLADGEIVAVEALARWRHPDRGLLAPDEFLSIAEETGMIRRVDAVVMEKACAAVAGWRTAYPDYRDLRLNVNVSPDELATDAVYRRVEHVLARNALELSMLTIEITEAAAMDDAIQAVARARRFVELGVELAIDDFGTGHSSLARLGQFPLHTLKIARPFVEGLGDRGKTSFVAAILEIAKAVGAQAVAEGVETETQAALLRELGCELGQGFLFARPLDADQVAALLEQRTRLPRAA